VKTIQDFGYGTRVENLYRMHEMDEAKSRLSSLLAAKHEACPVTGMPFFMTIEHPEYGDLPTYGGPFDSYTIPVKLTEDADHLSRLRFDHDLGGWRDWDMVECS